MGPNGCPGIPGEGDTGHFNAFNIMIIKNGSWPLVAGGAGQSRGWDGMGKTPHVCNTPHTSPLEPHSAGIYKIFKMPSHKLWLIKYNCRHIWNLLISAKHEPKWKWYKKTLTIGPWRIIPWFNSITYKSRHSLLVKSSRLGPLPSPKKYSIFILCQNTWPSLSEFLLRKKIYIYIVIWPVCLISRCATSWVACDAILVCS